MYILKDFKKYESFLVKRSFDDERQIALLFDAVAEHIDKMGADKLLLPGGFVRDLGLYLSGKIEMVEYFADVERRYLLLSDLYGYLKLKGDI